MIKNRFNTFLYAEAGEGTPGGGAAAPAATVEAGAETAAATAAAATGGAPEAEKNPGFLHQVLGSLRSKGSLSASTAAAEARAVAAEGKLATLQAAHDKLQGEVKILHDERAQIQQALEASQAEHKDGDNKAAAIVAGLGIAPGKVPAAEAAGSDNVEALIAQMDAETDPKKKHALAAKINALESKAD